MYRGQQSHLQEPQITCSCCSSARCPCSTCCSVASSCSSLSRLTSSARSVANISSSDAASACNQAEMSSQVLQHHRPVCCVIIQNDRHMPCVAAVCVAMLFLRMSSQMLPASPVVGVPCSVLTSLSNITFFTKLQFVCDVNII